MIWAALYYGQRGLVSVILLVASIAVLGTGLGFGPFAIAGTTEMVLLWNGFIGALAGTALILAAVIAERRGHHRFQRNRTRHDLPNLSAPGGRTEKDRPGPPPPGNAARLRDHSPGGK